MNIVYAAEKPSIAGVLSEHLKTPVTEGDIEISDNPAETGSFFIQWRLRRFVMAPDGRLVREFEPV